MRYYSIVITNPQTGKMIVPPVFQGANTGASYTSFVNGKTMPGALNVELDIPVAPFAAPMGMAYVRVWGVTLYEISQSYKLDGMAIKVFAGMQKGLPLANPKQAGLIVQGYIFQAFGNWVGKEMTLDIVISPTPTQQTPSASSITLPPNLTLNWKKGTQLSDAISQALSTAYPSLKSNVKINQNLAAPEDVVSYYSDLMSFAQFVKSRSAEIVGGTYPGVDIQLSQTTFNVYDGTTQTTPKQLEYQDLVGQPTWIEPATVQAKLIMRADLQVGGFIKFPKSPVVSSAQSVSPFVNERLTFQGSFLVQRIRHVGNFRQADGASWVTVVDAATIPVAAN